MSSKVAIIKSANYERERVDKAVREAVDLLGGMGNFVKKGSRVLIKPNLLAPKSPSTAVTTHPFVVEAVIDLVRENGGIPLIGDNPGVAGLKKVAKECGLQKIIERKGVELVKFNEYVELYSSKGYVFDSFRVAKKVLEADLIINLPKIKTHGHMLLTLAVKNLFGCLMLQDRINWHLKCGINRYFFATMLVELYTLINPQLTIVDGIVGMEGNGPGSGSPKKIGIIVAGQDCIAIDLVISKILGLSENELYTTKVAKERKIGITNWDEIAILGEEIDKVKIKDFQLPPTLKEITAWGIPVPKLLRTFLKQKFMTKPVINDKKCKLCYICVKNCPAKVISLKDKVLNIDLLKCIRCFCCQEFCPEGAITLKRSFF